MTWLRGIDAVAYKEALHAIRDPATLILALFVPVVQMLLFGYVFDTKVLFVPMLVLDEDRGTSAIAFRDALDASRTFRTTSTALTRSELRDALRDGRAHVAVDIPPGFTADVRAHRHPAVLVLIDGSDAQIAQEVYAAVVELGAQFGTTAGGAIDVRPQMLFNPSLRGAQFYIPGLVGIILQNITMMLTALAIVGERERGTLELLLVTPIAPAALLLGKIAPYAIIGMVDFASILFAAQGLFGIAIAGNVGLLFCAAAIFIIVALAMGILISTIAHSQMDALLRSFAILLPSIMLSGFFVDRELMPPILQWIGLAIPLTYFIEILRGIMVRGAGFADLWIPFTAMASLGIALFTAAVLRFGRATRA